MSAVYFTFQKSQIEYNVISGSHSNEISCVIACFNQSVCEQQVVHDKVVSCRWAFRMLILSIYVLLDCINTINKYGHAWVF